MKKRSLIGLLPIIYLICLGVFYSFIHEMYDSKQSRQTLIRSDRPNSVNVLRKGYPKKKVIRNKSLGKAISYPKDTECLPEAVAEVDTRFWIITSDSTAYLDYQQDTFEGSIRHYAFNQDTNWQLGKQCFK